MIPATTAVVTRPPYTATDYGLAIGAILTAGVNLVAMFFPIPIDPVTRGFAINALAALLGTLIVSFTGHRAAKHVVAALRA